MKTYAVTVPITGYVYLELKAENEEEARLKAFAADVSTEDIEEWDMHDEIVSGNVFHGQINRIDIEEV